MLNNSMKKAMRVINATIGYYYSHEKRDCINVNLNEVRMFVSDFVRPNTFSARKNDFKALFFLLQEYGYEYKETWTTPTCYHGWIPEHRNMYFYKKENPKRTVAITLWPKEKRIVEKDNDF